MWTDPYKGAALKKEKEKKIIRKINFDQIDLFRLGGLLSHYKSRDFL